MRSASRPRVSRRSLLTAGTALGLSGLVSGPAAAVPKSGDPAGGHLVLDYRPSQPTGWPEMPGKPSGTLGGHTASRDFAFNGVPHRVGLLSSVPVYQAVPADPAIAFEQTLAAAFGAHYAFRHAGGFRGRGEFRVQSYGVFATEATEAQPATTFGGGLYVVYEPDLRAGDPGIHETLRWIQVVRQSGTVENRHEVDNIGRANPFYMDGGLTSVHGTEVCNFHDTSQIAFDGRADLDEEFAAETFLTHDTGAKDRSGRGIVHVLGGIRWGWRVRRVE
ncbi:hypothetical protein ACFU8I_29835 [Streptomyces sp. NPDC057540]|uniref:hypothetical protein n=1 Tax=Streptomyces sp. NPDC057540 TaxID=3346160 RepID=UPI0036A64057